MICLATIIRFTLTVFPARERGRDPAVVRPLRAAPRGGRHPRCEDGEPHRGVRPGGELQEAGDRHQARLCQGRADHHRHHTRGSLLRLAFIITSASEKCSYVDILKVY